MGNKISKNFVIQEFVPDDIYRRYGNSSIWFIDKQIVQLAQFIRDWFGKPVIINNWHTGGAYRESGFRSPLTTTGATYSQHKSGRALDIKISGVDPEEIRNDIRSNFKLFNAHGLTTIEKDTSTWTHVDGRNTGKDKLFEVGYK